MKMSARVLVLVVMAGCQVEPPGELGGGRTEVGPRLADILAEEGCDTGPVVGLSLQIAAEMSCMGGGALMPFPLSERLRAASSAVIPYLSPEAGSALVAASRVRPLVLNSVFRTVGQQLLIYHWFKRGLCGFSAAATPGDSNHETGRAIDVEDPDGARATLESFGFFRTVPNDPVHFDHTASPDLRGLDVHAFQRLWNRNNPDDNINEDGDYGDQTEVRLLLTPAAGFPVGPCP